MMLGLSLVYLERATAAWRSSRRRLRLAEAAADHALALRGHLNLSDALQTLGRSRESAEVAERGVELAARVGLTRSVYGVLVDDQPTPRRSSTSATGTTAHRLLTRAMDNELASPYASVILDHRARIAALAGRYDDARADIDTAHRLLPARHGGQYSFARAFAAAEMGGPSATPPAPARRSAEPWSTRRSRRFPAYAWQLVWLGLRVEAEASEPAPDRVAALAALSRELPATTPPALAYRALADARVGPRRRARGGLDGGDRGVPEGRGPLPHRVRAAAPGRGRVCGGGSRERVGRRTGGRAAGGGARRGAAARRRARARAARTPADRRGRARGSRRTWPGSTRSA